MQSSQSAGAVHDICSSVDVLMIVTCVGGSSNPEREKTLCNNASFGLNPTLTLSVCDWRAGVSFFHLIPGTHLVGGVSTWPLERDLCLCSVHCLTGASAASDVHSVVEYGHSLQSEGRAPGYINSVHTDLLHPHLSWGGQEI